MLHESELAVEDERLSYLLKSLLEELLRIGWRHIVGAYGDVMLSAFQYICVDHDGLALVILGVAENAQRYLLANVLFPEVIFGASRLEDDRHMMRKDFRIFRRKSRQELLLGSVIEDDGEVAVYDISG